MSASPRARDSQKAIIGRQAELALLTAALERLEAGHGGCVAITGEPGIGKTRLARCLSSMAERRGQLVLPRTSDWSLGGGPAERSRARRTLRRSLEQHARERPVVVVLDGLDRADDVVLELAADLLRRPCDAPILLVLAYRRRAPRTLRAAVGTAARLGFLTRLELRALGDRDARQLLGDALDPATRSAIVRECGGNPRYLTELRDARRLRAAIAAELRSASPAARTVLRAASLAETSCDLDLLAHVAGLGPAVTAAAVDELLELELLRADAAAARFSCRHPVIRRVVYDTADARWLRDAHVRADRMLAARGAAASGRADHVASLARAGDEEAVRLLAEAGTASVSKHPAAAVRWLTRALSLLPKSADAERRVALQAPLALALGHLGRVNEGLAVLADARPRDPEVLRAAMRLDHMLGRGGAHRTVAVADAHDLAVDRWLSGAWDGLAARARGAPDAEALRAVAELHRGAVEPARSAADEAARAARGATDDELLTRLPALVVLGVAELDLERDGSASGHLARATALCRATGQDVWLPLLLSLQALVRTRRGDLRAASGIVDAALRSVMPGQDLALVWGLTQRGRLEHMRGDLTTARRTGEHAVALRRRVPDAPMPVDAGCALAAATIESGDAELGREQLLREAGGHDLPWLEPCRRPHGWELLATAELARGRVDAASHWAERAESAAAALDLAGAIAEARRAAAAVSLAIGEHAEAADLALDAAARFDGLARRIDAGRARIVAGQALLGLGARASAGAALRAAHVRLDADGADRYAEQAARALRRLAGPGGQSRSRSPVAARLGLSEHERELCRLVASGLTNREIGQRLFVSEKTVERRLTRVFRALGLSSRWELVARLRDRSDLLPAVGG